MRRNRFLKNSSYYEILKNLEKEMIDYFFGENIETFEEEAAEQYELYAKIAIEELEEELEFIKRLIQYQKNQILKNVEYYHY